MAIKSVEACGLTSVELIGTQMHKVCTNAVWWSLEDTKRVVFPLENFLKSIWYIGRKNKLFPLYRSCVLGFNKENAYIGHLVKGLDALLSRSRQVDVQKDLPAHLRKSWQTLFVQCLHLNWEQVLVHPVYSTPKLCCLHIYIHKLVEAGAFLVPLHHIA